MNQIEVIKNLVELLEDAEVYIVEHERPSYLKLYNEAISNGKRLITEMQSEEPIAYITETENHEPAIWTIQELEHKAEEAECVVMCLNDRGVPTSIDGKGLSLWGRVEQYAKTRDKE